MKTTAAIIAAIALAAGAAYANCGKKVTSAGTLKSYDKDTKTLTMEPKSSEKSLMITATTVVTGKDGKKASIEDLVGEKDLVVISEHGKIDSVGFKKDDEKKES